MKLLAVITVVLILYCINISCVSAQDYKPGLPGMGPSKWITLKHTQAPDRMFRTPHTKARSYTQEDVYMKVWLPVYMGPRVRVIAGPQYRTEQLAYHGNGENPLKAFSNWNLRSLGLDLKSVVALDTTSWLVANLHANQCSNLNAIGDSRVPANFTLCALYLKRKSSRKEVGAGFVANRLFNSYTFMPVLMMNYNFSSRSGIEMSLPQKIAWRNNLTPSDIIYIKAEAMSRSYYIRYDDKESSPFRRTEIDFGVTYNKQFNKLMGAEIFGGYRQNLSCQMPSDIYAVKNSGAVFTLELYVKPPRI
ncbi:MAG TPA: DUF6268 family outer membrane beta-barrel protein [Ohtaekwangia sp.]|uniref:DUF6268 family outer membrane beta-barrel protein n=1 Tax=Ohtaekwangia sp. TaxID=2066019 RepID=UPI002F953462